MNRDLKRRVARLEANAGARSVCDRYVSVWDIAFGKLSQDDAELVREQNVHAEMYGRAWDRFERAVAEAKLVVGIEGSLDGADYFL
jgi:hypothetical protein